MISKGANTVLVALKYVNCKKSFWWVLKTFCIDFLLYLVSESLGQIHATHNNRKTIINNSNDDNDNHNSHENNNKNYANDNENIIIVIISINII